MNPQNQTRQAKLRRRAATFLAFVIVATAFVGCHKGLQKVTQMPGSNAQMHDGENSADQLLTESIGRSHFSRLALGDSPERLPAIPGALQGADEEIWVISRSQPGEAKRRPDTQPASGALLTEIEGRPVPIPLKHTDVQASVSGYIGSVKVVQQFRNPYDSKIEAVYVFPLPENAAVNDFVMTIGSRRIRGIIREREEAEKIYQQAKAQGYVASLLTEERPNIFTQSVANIEPGKQIDVTIQYFHTLRYADGWYEFVFPMVVGPRFNPPGSTQGVGAAARTQSGASKQKTEVSYLAPQERSGHDISLRLDISAGFEIEEVVSPNHQIETTTVSPDHVQLTLSPSDTIPNKDFVCRYRAASDRVKTSLLTHRDARGGFFTLMVVPPLSLQNLPRQPMEMIFVVDCSGSMSGAPIAQAKAAVERGLRLLQPGDTFQVIDFSESTSQFGSQPLAATPANVQRGIAYVRRLNSGGGTIMLPGLRAALNFPHDPSRLRFVCFLTDGFIGSESEILTETHRSLGESRIFSFGVGSSPNRFLMDRMAKLGCGTVAYLGLKDDAGAVMDQFFERVSHPALTHIQIDWGGLKTDDVYPQKIPDLFVGRPVILAGRFEGTGRATVRITGKAGKNKMELTVPVDLAARDVNAAFPPVWARMKVADLSDRAMWSHNPFLPAQTKKIALEYNLMSAYTAFVAVDSSSRTTGAFGTTVPVPVPVPDGVRYDTTVRE